MTNLYLLLLYVCGLAAVTELSRAAYWSGFLGIPWQFFYPQGWLLLIAVGVAWFYFKQKPSLHTKVFVGSYVVALLLVSMWTFGDTTPDLPTWREAADHWYYQFRMDRTGMVSIVLLYAGLFGFLLVKPIHRADIVGMGTGFMLVAGEGYMWTENALCNLIYVVQGADVIDRKIQGTDQGYACSRVDLEYLLWLPAVVQIGILLWMAVMLSQAKARA